MKNILCVTLTSLEVLKIQASIKGRKEGLARLTSGEVERVFLPNLLTGWERGASMSKLVQREGGTL